MPPGEAGKLLGNLPQLWEEANLSERRNLLLTMLDAVYVERNRPPMVKDVRMMSKGIP